MQSHMVSTTRKAPDSLALGLIDRRAFPAFARRLQILILPVGSHRQKRHKHCWGLKHKRP